MITHPGEATAIAPSSLPRPARRNDFDWLRVGVVFMLFPFHTARVFDTLDSFYIKNSQTNELFNWIVIFAQPWAMALLFYLAGAASWYALDFRTGGRYAGERLRRLALPFLFALLLVVPPQAYLAQLSRHTFSGNIFEFYPVYFQNYSLTTSDFEGTIFTFAHLWFVFFLFIFSLVALPLFVYLKSAQGRAMISRLAGGRAVPVIFGIVPGLLVVATLMPNFLGKPVVAYLLFFVVGFILQTGEELRQVIKRYWYLTLAIGLVCTPFALNLFSYSQDAGLTSGKLGYIVSFILVAWFILCAILSFGDWYLNFSNPLLKYLNQASYPVYILHQTVIIVLAYYVVQWDLNIFLKFLVILTGSLAITLGLYELVIRRVGPLKALFGLKPGNSSS